MLYLQYLQQVEVIAGQSLIHLQQNVLVRISDASLASRFDISDNVFTITPAITVTTPNGGEDWTVGEQHNINLDESGYNKC